MLIISRKKDEKIIIANGIEITVLEVGRNRVRFGVNAPRDITIHTNLKSSPVTEQAVQVMESQVVVDEPKPQAIPAVAGFSNRR